MEKMVNVTIVNNLKRENDIVSEDMTLREVLEGHNVDYSKGGVNLDGVSLQPGDIDKTFKDFGIGSKCFLGLIVKADNAAK